MKYLLILLKNNHYKKIWLILFESFFLLENLMLFQVAFNFNMTSWPSLTNTKIIGRAWIPIFTQHHFILH